MKAVVVDVWPDDRMPVDDRGTRAEIIMDGGSIVNRLNPYRLTEQWLNGVLDTAWERVIQMGSDYDQAWQFILGLYDIISPRFAKIVRETVSKPAMHVRKVQEKGFYIWLPTDNEKDIVEMCDELEQYSPPLINPVTYKLSNGTVIRTERPVLIADQYFIMLEKIGDDYSAVSSPVLLPQGVPGKLTRSDKFSSPGRPQAIRGIGETEMRILNTMTDVDMTSDMLDIANSPSTHRYVCRQILSHPTPTKIQNILPREHVPRGNNRVTQQAANSLLAGGFQIEYRPVEE